MSKFDKSDGDAPGSPVSSDSKVVRLVAREAYARRFREAAQRLRQEPKFEEEIRLLDECGRRIFEADRLGYLPAVPSLRERIDWHTGDASNDWKPGAKAVKARCWSNLFLDVAGGNEIQVRLVAGGLELIVDPVRGTERRGGVLPESQPYILRFPDRERQATACEWLAELIEKNEPAVTTLGGVGGEVGGQNRSGPNLTPVRRQILEALSRSSERLTSPRLLEELRKIEPLFSKNTLRAEVAESGAIRQASWIDHIGKGKIRGYGLTHHGRDILQSDRDGR
jgi:hypothetical protein